MLTGIDELLHGESRAVGYATLGGVRITATHNGSDKLTVNLAVPEGWHINSNAPLQKGLIPTTLAVAEKPRGWTLENVDYPPADVKKLGFQRQPLSLYHGNVQISAELKPATNPSHLLPISIGLQACNDRVCLPPEQVNLHLTMSGDGG